MIYIVGAGYMAREYAKILLDMKEDFVVIGRGEKAVQKLKNELDVQVVSGGIDQFLREENHTPKAAIVCTPVDVLAACTESLLTFGVKNILLEKPGALSVTEISKLRCMQKNSKARVQIGYNRRFYQSTLALMARLKREVLVAANFEITEWSHLIKDEPCSDEVKQRWMYANTSHVIDLVEYISGNFTQLSTYKSGSLAWHSSSARFVGAGMTDKNVLISYCGYWDGPGRWSAEFVTTENRYILRPMEILQVQPLGSVKIEEVTDIDYSIDEHFKPGLYRQVKSFLEKEGCGLKSLSEQISSLETYSEIAGYATTS